MTKLKDENKHLQHEPFYFDGMHCKECKFGFTAWHHCCRCTIAKGYKRDIKIEKEEGERND